MKYENTNQLKNLFELQKNNRWNIANTTAKQRIAKLQKLREAILRRKQELYQALWQDFHKPKMEVWLCELFPTIEEIDEAIEHLEGWMKDKSGSWVFYLPTNKSISHFEPKGQVLIFAPWNYPFLLFVAPIVSAIAAGNVIIAKPSNKTPTVSAFLASLMEEIFQPEELAVIEGSGATVGDELLKLPFDHMFFTGSPRVGAQVGEMSQRVHAGVTLELGGKSPVVIMDDADLKITAQKLAWGKTLNAGQTCIAPDFVLCPRQLMQPLAEEVAKRIKSMYGETEQLRRNSEDFAHIVEGRAVERHKSLIEDALTKGATQVLGGECDIEGRYTPITILTGVTTDMSIMDSEIFGPLLPIMPYDNIQDAVKYIQDHPKPLSLYIFGKSRGCKNKLGIDYVVQNTTAGSTCINNCILQIENLSVPFGGIGMSGTGNYHGIYGFKTFSHERNIMDQGPIDLATFYHAPFYENNKGVKKEGRKLQKIAQWALDFLTGMGVKK